MRTSFPSSFLFWLSALAAITAQAGIDVPFSLPTGEKGTYLVTLAAVAPDDPSHIVSTFVSARPYTVTEENGGRFTAEWDGLDDDFLPVPPGTYGIKGIYTPAHTWPIDGEFHAITARYVGGAGSFLPDPKTPDLQNLPIPFYGDPVSSPMVDVDAADDGRIVLQYQYLENGRNCPILDLDRPDGPAQVLQAFPSGGVGGGPVACTDGDMAWACSRDGTADFVYRADGQPFGSNRAPARSGGFLPPGAVADMIAVPSPSGTKVWLAQRGRIVPIWHPEWNRDWPGESTTEFVNELTVHDGRNGTKLATVPCPRPQAFARRGDTLYILHRKESGDGFAVGRIPLRDGLPAGKMEPVFDLPADLAPEDLAIDSAGRFYVADPAKNHVWRLSPAGKIELRFGRADAQTPGAYDEHTFMGPTRLAIRRNAQDQDRLLVVEVLGPNRLSEWNPETGDFLRDYPAWQTFANSGWGPDPEHPEHVYLPGHGGWLVRWRVDYDSGAWKVDAVWPGLQMGSRLAPNKFAVIRAKGRLYIASEENASVYRLSDDGRAILLSASILLEDGKTLFWNDANGNGAIDPGEKRPCDLPPGVLTYHGQKWLPGLSYLAIGQGTPDVWRLSPDSFDAHGNPVFTTWTHVLTDPVFAVRRDGTASALHGAHELADAFTSDWMQADATPEGDVYIQARGGRNFSANFGAQHKVSRYVPDGNGGLRLAWRVGRTDFLHSGARGEFSGAMRLFRPLGGLLAVIDQTRSGVFLFTEDGLYVDTLFAPETLHREQGVYKQSGEFFVGALYGHPGNGRIYYAGGKFTPFLYEMEGWSLQGNPVKRLETLPAAVTLRIADIADPPEMALALRGGAGAARVASFAPAFGGVDLRNGSLRGWETASPIALPAGDKQSVEVRTLWDPDHLHLRWHVRTGGKVDPPKLADPTKIFAHDQGADTLSFHFQGDPDAPVPGPAGGRPGDVRLVFGLFRDNANAVHPLGMAFYPSWTGPNAKPAGYKTPVGEARFAHVARIPAAAIGWAMDEDGEGFVLSASVPRAVFPGQTAPFSGAFRSRCNFEANLGGHHRFWWSNADGSASTETWDEPTEARLYPGSWSPLRLEAADGGLVPREWSLLGPFGGPATKGWSYDPSPADKPKVAALFDTAAYAPDAHLGRPDFQAAYAGAETTGWWDAPAAPLRWTAAPLAEVDTRVQVGLGAQLWYGATILHAERDLEVDLELHGHPMTTTRWFLGETEITPSPSDWRDDPTSSAFRRLATRRVTLRKGANTLFFRAYCTGYPPFKLGARVLASPDDVWDLRSTPR